MCFIARLIARPVTARQSTPLKRKVKNMPALLPATTGTLDDAVNTGVGKASGVLIHKPDLPQKNLSVKRLFSNQGMQEFYEKCRALASDQTSDFWHTFGDVVRIAYSDGRNGNPSLYARELRRCGLACW